MCGADSHIRKNCPVFIAQKADLKAHYGKLHEDNTIKNKDKVNDGVYNPYIRTSNRGTTIEDIEAYEQEDDD